MIYRLFKHRAPYDRTYLMFLVRACMHMQAWANSGIDFLLLTEAPPLSSLRARVKQIDLIQLSGFQNLVHTND